MRATKLAIKKLDQQTVLHVKIKIAKELKVRLWIARNLIWLAAIIMGCGVNVETETTEKNIVD